MATSTGTAPVRLPNGAPIPNEFPAPRDSINLSVLSNENRDAYQLMRATLQNYGLGELSQILFDYFVQGYTADTINVLIQDTDPWKKRFAGNEIRRKQGLPVLSPQEYIQTEASYRQILKSAGMPVGFFDQPSDFTNWIGGDVSPSEIQKRVDLAVQKTTFADKAQKQALKQFYGVDEGGIAAYFLDTARALPLLQQQAEIVGIGSEALRRGLGTSLDRAQELFQQGVSADQARQGFESVNEILLPTQRLAALSRMGYSQNEAENEVFGLGLGAEAGQKRKRLIGEEMARFAGASGFGQQTRETAGQF